MENLWGGMNPLGVGDYYPAIRDRLYDGGYSFPGYVSSAEPLIGVFDLPGLTGSSEQQHALWDYLQDRVVTPIYDRWNVISLAHEAGNPKNVNAIKLVRGFDDLKGLKLRAFNEMLARIVRAAGATPVTLAWAEVTPGLQRGIIDGLPMTMTYMYDVKLYDLVKYVWYGPDFGDALNGLMINKDAFNELPPDLQAIVMQVAKDTEKEARARTEQNARSVIAKVIAEYGVTVVGATPAQMDEFTMRMQPIWDDWAKAAGPQGPEILQMISDFKATWTAAK